MLLVAIVAGGIAGPNDKINFILDIVSKPVKGSVDKRKGRVAVSRLSPVCACWTVFSVAGDALFCGRMNFVKWVGMEVCTFDGADELACVDQTGCEYEASGS